MAFLFRHDHGIYLGLAGMLAAWLATASDGRRGGHRRALAFVAIGLVLVAPYLVYVQVYDGIWAYLQKGLEFRNREFGRAEYVLPTFSGENPLHAVVFYAYWTFPLIAAALVLTRRRDATARVLPVVVVALLLNATFARPPMNARLPDAVVPFVTLAAWLAITAWHTKPSRVARPLVAALGLLVAASVVSVDRTVEHLDRAGLLAPFSDWPRYARRTREILEAPHDPIVLPSRAAEDLVPFYDYVARCTSREHRILVAGLIPEVVFFTHRPFAGGIVILPPGYYAAEHYQRSVVNRLRQQTVPFVVIPGKRYIDSFDSLFPLVADHVRARYAPLATFGDEDEWKVDVLIDRTLTADARDAATGWPCPAPSST
jgi:hypothetical protein